VLQVAGLPLVRIRAKVTMSMLSVMSMEVHVICPQIRVSRSQGGERMGPPLPLITIDANICSSGSDAVPPECPTLCGISSFNVRDAEAAIRFPPGLIIKAFCLRATCSQVMPTKALQEIEQQRKIIRVILANAKLHEKHLQVSDTRTRHR
jgi:hypothetical protein